jgi:hypothetical protein
MRTDADDPARVRDPAIELLLSHTATLTDEWRGSSAVLRLAPERCLTSREFERSRLWHRLRRGLNKVGNLVGVRDHPDMT